MHAPAGLEASIQLTV